MYWFRLEFTRGNSSEDFGPVMPQWEWPITCYLFFYSVVVSGYLYLACENSRPSRETPLGPGAKKDGCFRRLKYQI